MDNSEFRELDLAGDEAAEVNGGGAPFSIVHFLTGVLVAANGTAKGASGQVSTGINANAIQGGIGPSLDDDTSKS